jgi:glycosyltransferase involved in cell wall biosynthesis
LITAKEISIVLPVKNNQSGLTNFLDSFFQETPSDIYPREIIIVDNNSDRPVKLCSGYYSNELSIRVLKCKNRGAAAARNLGVYNAQGKWILFTDSDCIASDSFVSGYLCLNSENVAYSGNVRSLKMTFLNRYYEDQGTLLPPEAEYGNLSNVPLYIVTANAIVNRAAYLKIGGFNERYPAAGGEDEDFSLRLWTIGNIEYVPGSVIYHDFKNGIFGFIKRFINYGRGSYITEKTWGIKKKPHLAIPRVKSNKNIILAYFQYFLMLFGYWCEKRNEDG